MIDMFCHWSYVLRQLFGEVEAVTTTAVTHLPERWDEHGQPYKATADDAAYALFELAGGVVAQINSSWCVRVKLFLPGVRKLERLVRGGFFGRILSVRGEFGYVHSTQ